MSQMPRQFDLKAYDHFDPQWYLRWRWGPWGAYLNKNMSGYKNQKHSFHNLLVVFKHLINGKQGSLCVQCIKDSLHQQNVGTTIQQTTHLLRISSDKFIKCNVSKSRILDGRRNRTSTIGRTNSTTYKATNTCFSGNLIGQRWVNRNQTSFFFGVSVHLHKLF